MKVRNINLERMPLARFYGGGEASTGLFGFSSALELLDFRNPLFTGLVACSSRAIRKDTLLSVTSKNVNG
jgi:hypothetical protein